MKTKIKAPLNRKNAWRVVEVVMGARDGLCFAVDTLFNAGLLDRPTYLAMRRQLRRAVGRRRVYLHPSPSYVEPDQMRVERARQFRTV